MRLEEEMLSRLDIELDLSILRGSSMSSISKI